MKGDRREVRERREGGAVFIDQSVKNEHDKMYIDLSLVAFVINPNNRRSLAVSVFQHGTG